MTRNIGDGGTGDVPGKIGKDAGDDAGLEGLRADVTPPAAVRDAIRSRVGTIAPVRPLASIGSRAAMAEPITLALALAGAAVLGLLPRDGAPWLELPMFTAVAAVGCWLAVRSSVPGAVPSPRVSAPFFAAPLIFAAAALALAGLGGGNGPIGCLLSGVAVSSVPALSLLFFVFRGYPTSPVLSGAIAGMSGGLLGGAVLQIHCPMTTGPHLVLMHDGVLVVSTAAFALLGGVVARVRAG